MRSKGATGACLFFLLMGCTQDDGYFNNGYVYFPEPKKIGENYFIVIAEGAGANTKEDVIEAFHWKARQLCECSEYESEMKIEPYQYNSSGGGYFFTHDALRAVGTIKWQSAENNEGQ